MTKAIIKQASIEQAQIMSRMIIDSICETNANDYTKEQIAMIITHFTTEKVIEKMGCRDVFIALLNGHCAGTISLEGNRIHSLFVSTKFQGTGIGRQLLEYIEQHASALGFRTLILSSSITAKPFYQKYDYDVVNIEKRTEGDTIAMQKQI